ncbi:MAG TPA: AMP-binding protein, partial [Acidimicrobiales bacterium]|nr:AMP-binding protein [Acidimicrobiales bacterium]
MHVPLTIGDFLERAALVHGADRVAVVDEPGVAGSLGAITYAEMHDRARGMALALDAMGVAHGERVAIVSPNSARFLISFFGVSGFGRVLVPVNFRLNADEVAYIVEHSGASVLLVDPELEGPLAGVSAKVRML